MLAVGSLWLSALYSLSISANSFSIVGVCLFFLLSVLLLLLLFFIRGYGSEDSEFVCISSFVVVSDALSSAEFPCWVCWSMSVSLLESSSSELVFDSESFLVLLFFLLFLPGRII